MRMSDSNFYASGKMTQAKIWPSDMDVLKVDACLLDTISRVESIYTPDQGSTPDIAAWLELVSNHTSGEVGSRNSIEALWRTLMADDDKFLQYGGDASEPVPRQSFKNYLCRHLREVKGREDGVFESIIVRLEDRLKAGDPADLIPTRDEVEKLQNDDERLKEVVYGHKVDTVRPDKSRFEACLAVYSRRRVLFRTKLGYIGLGFDTTETGDQVWILAGARTPFVLRSVGDGIPNQEKFQLVGECYVHGVMRGEAVAAQNAEFEPIIIH